MSKHQEVWITLRIQSELPVEQDAHNFASSLAAAMVNKSLSMSQLNFLMDASCVPVLEVKEERHIYGTED